MLSILLSKWLLPIFFCFWKIVVHDSPFSVNGTVNCLLVYKILSLLYVLEWWSHIFIFFYVEFQRAFFEFFLFHFCFICLFIFLAFWCIYHSCTLRFFHILDDEKSWLASMESRPYLYIPLWVGCALQYYHDLLCIYVRDDIEFDVSLGFSNLFLMVLSMERFF